VPLNPPRCLSPPKAYSPCQWVAALASAVLPDGARRWNLANLSERVLRKSLPKEERLRLSDWEARLSPDQLEYAALDALASLRICVELERLAANAASGLVDRLIHAVPEDPMRSRPAPATDCHPCLKAQVTVATKAGDTRPGLDENDDPAIPMPKPAHLLSRMKECPAVSK
jgi:hypothetical protein